MPLTLSSLNPTCDRHPERTAVATTPDGVRLCQQCLQEEPPWTGAPTPKEET